MISITYDTDHMTDELMRLFLETVYPKHLPGTFFCTQYYPDLQSLGVDVAIHPIFDQTTDWLRITKELVAAHEKHGHSITGVRPHSCANSQKFSVQMNSIGIKYCSQLCIPFSSELAPFVDDWGVIQFPIRFMDNANLWNYDRFGGNSDSLSDEVIDAAITSETLFVFDFHPIHLLLNTSHLDQYSRWRTSGVLEVNHKNYGVRDFYNRLITRICESGVTVLSLNDYVIGILKRTNPSI